MFSNIDNCSDVADTPYPPIVSGILQLTAFTPGGNYRDTMNVVSIDIAKSFFQGGVWMADGSSAWNKEILRQTLPF